MRGAFFIIILITMLIVGILVIKDYHSPSSTDSDQTKKVYIEKTEEAVKTANKATNRIKQAAESLND